MYIDRGLKGIHILHSYAFRARTARMPEWLWGWLQEHYDFLATFMATPPVYPGFESQFVQTNFFLVVRNDMRLQHKFIL